MQHGVNKIKWCLITKWFCNVFSRIPRDSTLWVYECVCVCFVCNCATLCNTNSLVQNIYVHTHSNDTFCLSSALSEHAASMDTFFPAQLLFRSPFFPSQDFDSASLNTIFLMLLAHTQGERERKRRNGHRIEIDVNPEVRENGENVQIKISHECHTERNGRSNTVSLLSPLSPFVLFCRHVATTVWAAVWLFFLQAHSFLLSVTSKNEKEYTHTRARAKKKITCNPERLRVSSIHYICVS